ncbi:hypothetical protein ABFY60_01035 [Lysinibacillus pakistanensis]|uniref:hypothetical protein n=1 Tax=Lysinibacillus pakistanensis TaxID=759811 RepID=UPI003D2BB183
MRKYIYNAVIIVFVLQMSHVQVFANYEHKKMATANSIGNTTKSYSIRSHAVIY